MYAIVAKFQDRIKIIICEITFVQGSVNKKVQVWQSSTNEWSARNIEHQQRTRRALDQLPWKKIARFSAYVKV